MKIKFLFTLLLTSLLFMSCEDSTQKVINVNDTITDAYNNVYFDANVLGDKLAEVVDAGIEDADFKGLTEIREKFKVTVDESIKKVEAIENFGDSEAYKEATLAYLKYSQDLSEYIKRLESFTKETDESEITGWFEELDRRINLENSLVNKVHTTQKDFAAKNNLELIEEK